MSKGTMNAARLHEVGGRFKIDSLPIPELRPHDVLVRVEAAGIVPNLRNVISLYPSLVPELPLPDLPAVFGLDFSGEVVEVGNLVNEGISVGDRVYVNPGLSCGTCIACRRGEHPNCPSYTFMGYFGFGPKSQNQFSAYPYGGFAEYASAPSANLIKLPPSVTYEQGARFGYLGTAYSALRKADFRAGQTLLVNGGTGTLGVGTVLLALAMGASRIFATGRDVNRLARLRALDPKRVQTISSSEQRIAEQVLAATGQFGVDVLIEALAPGAGPASVEDAFEALRRGGKAINIGGVSAALSIQPGKLMVQQKSLSGSLWFSVGEGEDMAAMAESGALRLDVFDTVSYRLDQVNAALDEVDSHSGGFSNVVIRHGP